MLTSRFILFYTIFLCVNTKICYTQSTIDSLRSLIPTLEGKEKIDAQYQLADRLVNVNPREAKIIAREMISQSETLDYQKGLAMGYHSLGAVHNLLSQLDSAIIILEKGLEASETLEDKIYEGRIIIALSASYLRDYQLSKVQALTQKGLEIGAQLGNQSMKMTCLMNMAIVTPI